MEMELFLNLFWLTLGVPAAWVLVRGQCRGWERHRRMGSAVVLGCVLLLLFPVISATDDLHAMRPEMEESCPSKLIAKQAAGEKSPHSKLSGDGTLPAQLVQVSFTLEYSVCGLVSSPAMGLPEDAQPRTNSCRAPPSSFLIA